MADTLSDAQERFQEALDALDTQRRQVEEDLEFSDPTDPQQWDKDEKVQREQDPGGARPCLVLDQCGQYVANVAGQIEQRPPALHVIPVGDGADRKVAEKLDGAFRHIEYASRASQHYARALTSAARVGVGYLIVRPEYTDRALNYQEPRISSEGDPLRVVFDPWSVELDGSDATYGVLLSPMSPREFVRQFGKDAKQVSFGDTGEKDQDERESIIVAEEWRIEVENRPMVIYTDAQGTEGSMLKDDFEQAVQNGATHQLVREYSDKYRCVKWSRMSGADIFDDAKEYPADGIGIIPVYGYVGWSEGRMKYCGIPRRARAAQRAYNYHQSEIRAYMGQAPKSPWLASTRAIKGLEHLWDRASVDARAYLPYNDIDEQQQPITPPQRMPLAMNLQNHIESAQQSLRDIQAAIGMYQANLGAPSNETSGVAIENRKQQGEASTAHFPAHSAASLGQVGKLCMQMYPKLIDTKRQMRVLGIDMTPSTVTIDPKQTQGVVDTGDGGISINPNVGKYDVRVVVGASFSTQRQQAQEAYTEMMRANPQMMPAIAPLWAQTLDVPHADKLAQVLTAMAPEPVKAILQPDQQDSTATLQAENDQLKKALQEAIQHAHDAQQEADQANAQLEDKSAEKDAKDDEIAVKAYDALTKRIQVVGANQQIVLQAQQAAMSQPEPSEKGSEVAEAPASEAAPVEGEAPQQEGAADPPHIQELMAGQEHIAQLLEMLIKVVQQPMAPVGAAQPQEAS